MNKICQNCRFWAIETEVTDGKISIADCRRHSPFVQGWPRTRLYEWCGEFKTKPEEPPVFENQSLIRGNGGSGEGKR